MSILYKFGKSTSMERLGRSIIWRKETNKKMRENAQKLSFIGKREMCPICNTLLYNNYATFFGVSYMECETCGHLFQYEIVDPISIKEIYENDSSYLTYLADDRYFRTRIEMVAAPKVYYINSIVKKLDSTVEWLDIGCGACDILYMAKKLGWKVRGIETGDIGVVQGKKLDIEIEQQYITQENASHLLKKPYLISLFDVLEHLDDPLNVLKNILDNSPTCEYVVIEVPHHPSLSAFVSKLFPEDLVRHLVVPDHIHIFTEKSISLLVEKCGFEITNCWKFGQDFYETMSMLTQQAKKDIDCWPKELFNSVNDVQFALDKNGLSDLILIIAKRKK